MRTKLLVAAVALATAAGPIAYAGGAPDASPARAPHHAPAGTQLQLTFDNGESFARNSGVRDTSGHRHHGRVKLRKGGTLTRGAGFVKRGADFPRRCAGCGRAIIEVADAPKLDPRSRSFIFGAAVKVTRAQGQNGSNLVQKGFFHQPGGQYKLQLTSIGTASCVVFGGKGRLKVTANRVIARGRWHRLACVRTPTGVTLRIDGHARATIAGATGRIRNSSPLRVGGNKAKPGNNQFHGDLDSVFMRLLPR